MRSVLAGLQRLYDMLNAGGARQRSDVGGGDDDVANISEASESTQGAHVVQLPRRTRTAEGAGGPREVAEGH
eukprot:5610068-Pyramimonas_sp.AAC.1